MLYHYEFMRMVLFAKKKKKNQYLQQKKKIHNNIAGIKKEHARASDEMKGGAMSSSRRPKIAHSEFLILYARHVFYVRIVIL